MGLVLAPPASDACVRAAGAKIFGRVKKQNWVATRMDAEFTTEVRFYRLSEALQPYFTALYATSIDCSADVWVRDRLHPEWAALRFTEGPPPIARVGVGEMFSQWPFVANGPTSQAIQFGVTRSRVWGLGLQPAGWSKFVGVPADGLSDETVDGSAHDAFVLFRPIHD